MEQDIENIFSPDKNNYFNHGQIKRWIAVNAYNEAIGRIAAFIDFDKMYEGDVKIGSIGFFESVENRIVAFSLFDKAVQWLSEMYRVDIVQGPVNFGENDKYWGLLVEGFTSPSYGMNFNPLYYKIFFEDYGFKIQYNQLTNYVSLSKPLPERFEKIASRVVNNPRYSFRHFLARDKDLFIKDFVEIYNKAWSSFTNFHPMSEEYIRRSFDELRPILEDEFIWFAYVENNILHYIPIRNPLTVHSLIGFVLSLLLVFRTNTAYDRWWEGRRLWGSFVNNSRNFALKLATYLPEDHEAKETLRILIGNYVHAVKDHLRGRVDMQ
ncbi:MAG: GNAT family N-acetyltransferase, partial [Chitinophagaceae bacterium]